MTDSGYVDPGILEYGILPPAPEDYDSSDAYTAAYNAWLAGFEAYLNRKRAEEAQVEAARQAMEEAAREEGREEEVQPVPEVVQLPKELPESSDRYSVGSYIDAAGNVWSPAGELLYSGAENSYPSGVYVDPAGNLWSETGELLSPGTTPAMEPGLDELAGEIVGEPVTGDPTIDTALLLVDLLDALTGEEGMTSDVDGIQEAVEGIQQALDHPLMTTSFQDYTVTEGLLLLLLSMFMAACAKMLKEGFTWLR